MFNICTTHVIRNLFLKVVAAACGTRFKLYAIDFHLTKDKPAIFNELDKSHSV